MMKEKKTFQPLTSSDVCQIYEYLLERKFVSFPLTQEGKNKVESLVSNITGSYFGNEIYKSAEEKALAYLYFLIKDHPFTDGNKRTASLAFDVVCFINGLKPDYWNESLDVLAIFIEKTKEVNHHEVIETLVELTFPQEKHR